MALADAIALRNRGLKVGFASADGAWRRKLRGTGILFHRLDLVDPDRYGPAVRYGPALVLTTARLAYLVWRYGYTCLYVHHWQSSIPSAIVARLLRVRYVFMAHLAFRAPRWAVNPGRHMIAVSEAVKRDYVQRLALRPEAVSVLENAVNTDVRDEHADVVGDFERRWRVPATAPLVSSVGLLNVQKAQHVLLEAWPRVLEVVPDAILLLAGEGPLRTHLEKMCSELRIEDSVRFVGQTEEVGVIYQRSRCVVLSSIVEGMPLVPLEAAAYGTPTIATAVGGTPEVVRHDETGLLVPPGDHRELSSAISRLLRDAALRDSLGARARQFVAARYSATIRTPQLLSMLFNHD